MLELPAVFEVGSLIVIVAILLADLLVVARRPHVPTLKESGVWVGLYVGLALLFAVAMFVFAGGESAGQFLAGWLTEYSLSIDNLFVFVILMARFSVPKTIQQEVLMLGIIIALVLRGVFILLGARLIEDFSWIFYLFGAWLIWTAIQQLRGEDEDDDKDSLIVRLLRKRVRITDTYDGMKFRVVQDGARHFTPLLVVLIAIGTTDLLFALDSIPAIFGITESAFIVFTANVFALMGLRQLYFLLGGLLERLVYLKYGIAGDPRVHRREARAARPARQRAALHQRRRARGVGARDRHGGVAARDRRGDGRGDRRQPAADPPRGRRARRGLPRRRNGVAAPDRADGARPAVDAPRDGREARVGPAPSLPSVTGSAVTGSRPRSASVDPGPTTPPSRTGSSNDA